MVPHFRLFKGSLWWRVLYYFAYALGYEVVGTSTPQDKRGLALFKKYSVGGYFYAAVPSRNFKGVAHAVIVDCAGKVVWDPSPRKKWQGVKAKKYIEHIYLFKRLKDANIW